MMKYWTFSLKQGSDFIVNVCEGGERRRQKGEDVCFCVSQRKQKGDCEERKNKQQKEGRRNWGGR